MLLRLLRLLLTFLLWAITPELKTNRNIKKIRFVGIHPGVAELLWTKPSGWTARQKQFRTFQEEKSGNPRKSSGLSGSRSFFLLLFNFTSINLINLQPTKGQAVCVAKKKKKKKKKTCGNFLLCSVLNELQRWVAVLARGRMLPAPKNVNWIRWYFEASYFKMMTYTKLFFFSFFTAMSFLQAKYWNKSNCGKIRRSRILSCSLLCLVHSSKRNKNQKLSPSLTSRRILPQSLNIALIRFGAGKRVIYITYVRCSQQVDVMRWKEHNITSRCCFLLIKQTGIVGRQ